MLFCVSFSPVNGELQREKYSYVDQLPVSEIIHQVRDPYKHPGQLGTLETHEQAHVYIIQTFSTSTSLAGERQVFVFVIS